MAGIENQLSYLDKIFETDRKMLFNPTIKRLISRLSSAKPLMKYAVTEFVGILQARGITTMKRTRASQMLGGAENICEKVL